MTCDSKLPSVSSITASLLPDDLLPPDEEPPRPDSRSLAICLAASMAPLTMSLAVRPPVRRRRRINR